MLWLRIGKDRALKHLSHSNKTWTLGELMLRLRRDVVLDILGQVQRNFQNIGVFLQQRLDLSSWWGLEGLDMLNFSMYASRWDTDSRMHARSDLSEVEEIVSVEQHFERGENEGAHTQSDLEATGDAAQEKNLPDYDSTSPNALPRRTRSVRLRNNNATDGANEEAQRDMLLGTHAKEHGILKGLWKGKKRF
jgi:hypothetical protein